MILKRIECIEGAIVKVLFAQFVPQMFNRIELGE